MSYINAPEPTPTPVPDRPATIVAEVADLLRQRRAAHAAYARTILAVKPAYTEKDAHCNELRALIAEQDEQIAALLLAWEEAL